MDNNFFIFLMCLFQILNIYVFKKESKGMGSKTSRSFMFILPLLCAISVIIKPL